MNTVEALQTLYVALGGELTDSYNNIGSGALVSDLVTIPDMIQAIAELKSGGDTPSDTE